jgi:hypothetical protein
MIGAEHGHQEIRDAVRALCAQFPPAYFRKLDAERGYPSEFVDALTRAGWLAALIPQEYGGSGLGITEASVIMEEINRSGANALACHGQMYNMGTLLRHGSAAQKAKYLPAIAKGELRLQSMGVTEPSAGTDTTAITTTAARKGDRYVVNGQKAWISRVQHSDLMILLARTTPLRRAKKSEGLSIFLVDLRAAIGTGLTVRPIETMVSHDTNELFFDNLEIPAENLIGEEGRGFRYILDGSTPSARSSPPNASATATGSSIASQLTPRSAWFSGGPSAATRGCNSPSPRPSSRWRPRTSCVIAPAHCSTRARRAARKPTWPSTSPRRLPGRRKRVHPVPWGLRIRRGIRRRAQIPRDAPLPGRADLHQPHPGLRRRARARLAALLLSPARDPLGQPDCSALDRPGSTREAIADMPAPSRASVIHQFDVVRPPQVIVVHVGTPWKIQEPI